MLAVGARRSEPRRRACLAGRASAGQRSRNPVAAHVPTAYRGRVASVLIGRNAEIQAAERFLASLDDGPAAVSIQGEPGIGKTALLEAIVALSDADRVSVLRARAVAAEADLGFAGLSELIAAVPNEVLRRLPQLQRQAIDSALLRGAGDPDLADTRALGMALWTILRELSAG